MRVRMVMLFLTLLLAACQRRDPLVVYITPTPDQSAAQAASETVPPTTAATATITPSPTATPTSTPTDLPTTTSTATATLTMTVPAATEAPAATMAGEFGPIVATDYVLPTPVPPTEGPTPLPPAAAQVDLPLPDLNPELIGIQIDSNRQRDAFAYSLDRTTQLGVGWIKIQLNWINFQPDGPNQDAGPEIQLLGDMLRVTEDRGIKVLVSVAKAPMWARSNTTEDGPPDDPQAFANYLTWFFQQKGAEYIDAVEIWNEPNLQREWQGQPLNGASYMQYFDAAYRAIRSFNGQITIVTAGLAPTSDSDVSRDDRTYLQEMYNAGLSNYRDVVVGVHPYGWANAPDATCCPEVSNGWDEDPHFFFLDNLNGYREVMNNSGHNGVQMWITEFGWATWDGYVGSPPERWLNDIDKWEQGNYIIRAYEILQARSDVGVVFLWNLNFAQQHLIEARDERAAFALLPEFPGARLRPAFWMLYDAVRLDETLDTYDRDG